jgi:citrate synthase
MINTRISSAEAAARLGIKPATLYAYVSRGLLHPERGPRGSTYDVREVARLARSARRPVGGAGGSRRRDAGSGVGAEPVFVTELSLIDEGHLYYRGRDAVELSRTMSFEDVVEWLWTGEERVAGAAPRFQLPSRARRAVEAAAGTAGGRSSLVERFMGAVVAAGQCDDLRHDLTPSGVAVTGRRVLAALAASLPAGGEDAEAGPEGSGPLAERIWESLAGRPPSESERAVADAALVLAADHELAPSTLAARVAASFRADPYAVVLTGLGPASGTWEAGSTGAPGEVEILLLEAERVGAERAIGERLRRSGQTPHGFGMPLYPDGDPRGAELLRRLDDMGRPDRASLVRTVLAVGRDQGFPPPNFDLGLAAFCFCAGMAPGSAPAVLTLAKAAGWLAHAREEYVRPSRFRARADYVGPAPEPMPAP